MSVSWCICLVASPLLLSFHCEVSLCVCVTGAAHQLVLLSVLSRAHGTDPGNEAGARRQDMGILAESGVTKPGA